MKRMLQVTVTSLLLAVGANLVNAASDEVQALQNEIADLKKGQEAMQKDLAEIKKLIKERPAGAAAGPAFKPQDVSVAGAAYKGDMSAPVTIIEFSDYQCPFCKRHAENTMPTLVEKYVDTGKVKIVMKENPIESIHKNAMGASIAALCAGDQGKYWEMHDIMFANYRNLSTDELKGYAGEIGLDDGEFGACLDSEKYKDTVKAHQSTGRKLGVRGTPGFVVGLTDPKNPETVKASKFIRGAQSADAFSEAIDELLESEKS